VALAGSHPFVGRDLCKSVRSTFERRRTPPDADVLDDMKAIVSKREWKRAWATMLTEKAAAGPIDLAEAVAQFDRFVRPILLACSEPGDPPGEWPASGPWRSSPLEKDAPGTSEPS
jgi:hypothetical protein